MVDEIKKSAFVGLNTPEDSIKRASAKLIASIFTMGKLYHRQDMEIIPVLIQTLGH